MRAKMMIGFASTALLLMGTVVSAETYSVDPAHTSLAFSVRHLGISNVRGHFGEFAGTIVLDQGAIKKADATMQVKSIDTGVKQRDDHLRSATSLTPPNIQSLPSRQRVRKRRTISSCSSRISPFGE